MPISMKEQEIPAHVLPNSNSNLKFVIVMMFTTEDMVIEKVPIVAWNVFRHMEYDEDVEAFPICTDSIGYVDRQDNCEGCVCDMETGYCSNSDQTWPSLEAFVRDAKAKIVSRLGDQLAVEGV